MDFKKNVIENRINEIIDQLLARLKKDNLISLSIIGSFSDEDHEVEMNNDLDILYIYEDANPNNNRVRMKLEDLKDIEKVSNEIINEYSDDYIDVIPCFKCGPFKPAPSDKINIELHHIVYTPNRWIQEAPTFLFDRANKNRLLYGINPSEIYKLDNITKYNIKRDLFGIHHSIKMIEEGVIKYCIWEPSESSDILKVKVHSEDVSSINDKDRYAFLELICYSVIKNTINANRIKTKSVQSFNEETGKVRSLSDEIDMVFFQQIVELKNDLRWNKLNINEIDFELLSKKAVKFLYDLSLTL